MRAGYGLRLGPARAIHRGTKRASRLTLAVAPGPGDHSGRRGTLPMDEERKLTAARDLASTM
jgi:hypothetical protein